MRLVLDPAAKAELREAAVFYEDYCSGLGQEFVAAVEAAFAQIQQRPATWRVLKGRYRRYLVHRFPYAVIYAVEGRTVFIAAVMHLKRKPGYWEGRGTGG